MSLDWDITKCDLTKEGREENWQEINDMIWATMGIGIGSITTDNLITVEIRLRVYGTVIGVDYSKVIELLPKLVGLKTNVFPNISEKAFNSKMGEWLYRDASLAMTRELARKKREAESGEQPEKPITL